MAAKEPDSSDEELSLAGNSEDILVYYFRIKCQYGAACYRKNPHHRERYCHPGDDDWKESMNTKKSKCPFGINCYRKNVYHRQYFHGTEDLFEASSKKDHIGVALDAIPNMGGPNDNLPLFDDANFQAVRPKIRVQRADSSDNSCVAKSKVIKPAKTMFECGCCFTEFPMKDKVKCSAGHLFCKSCLKSYVESIVFGGMGGSLKPVCMSPDCGAPFEMRRIRRHLDQKLIDRLEEEEQQLMLAQLFGGGGGGGSNSDESLHQCPFCSFSCLISNSNQVFQCFQCMKESCQFCKVEWNQHLQYGLICEDVETQDESQLRRKTEEAMTEALVRKCPKCTKMLIKDAGCNKLTCPCGTLLCNICKQVINGEGYNHFCQHQNGFDHGQKGICTLCKKCSLINEVGDEDQVKVEAERVKGEEERVMKGFNNKKKIGGDAITNVLAAPTGNLPAQRQLFHQPRGRLAQRGLVNQQFF